MEEHEINAKWDIIYRGLHESGLVLFEPDGIMVGDEIDGDRELGVECLIDLRTHFERREAYGGAEFVNKMIVEYQKRWPEAYNREYNLLLKPAA